MKLRISLKLFFLVLFIANQVFAKKFYSQSSITSNSQTDLIGDLNFSYNFNKDKNKSTERFEKDNLSITITREPTSANLWIEKKTRYGFLILKYKNYGSTWKNNQATFRRYTTLFKDMGEDCSTSPIQKNQNDLATITKETQKQRFAQLFFEKNCSEKLSEPEFSHLIDATYTLFKGTQDTLESIKDPQIAKCTKIQSREGPLFIPFQDMRAKVSLLLDESTKPDDIINNSSVPFPISCEFNLKSSKSCGTTTEGIKDKIRLNVNCLKESGNRIQQKSQEAILHEFSHTIRKPMDPSEKQIRDLEKGNCNPQDVVFAGDKETNISKDKVVAAENSKQSGAKTIAGDVVNPYSAFVETPQAPSASQGTRIATNAPAATEVSDTSIASRTSTQRSVASVGTFANTASSFSVNTNIPTMQQQAQYQNVKAYVDASVGVVAKKIAPIVSYVESPAFAATLPPSSFANSNSGNSEASDTEIPKSATAAKARSASASASSNNEVSSGAGGSSSSASLGTSSSSGNSTRSPAAINRNAAQGTVATGLDNVYALKVRKRLVSESSYREELRSKGIQIEFADGYKFETQGSKIQYTEQNGVLIRGK